jgi:carbamoyltransferase
VERADLQSRFKILPSPSRDWIVASLISDKIIAHMKGRMEFGQRALGNRSILANPSNPMNIQKINRKIKFRDFWMPFTPTILAEREGDYLENPKKLRSPFMTMAFDSKELARRELISALHPADYTVRPQVLKKEDNPRYYDLIKSFEKKTNIGGLLNTSLNLHGEPMVCSPEDAIHTFLNSELDILLFDNFLAVVRG